MMVAEFSGENWPRTRKLFTPTEVQDKGIGDPACLLRYLRQSCESFARDRFRNTSFFHDDDLPNLTTTPSAPAPRTTPDRRTRVR